MYNSANVGQDNYMIKDLPSFVVLTMVGVWHTCLFFLFWLREGICHCNM